MGRLNLLFVLAAMCLGTACENEFTPKAEIEDKVAVFCVLDPALEYQTVLLFRSYDAELGIPLQPLTSKEVTEADVRIMGEGEVFQFQDTLVTDRDGNRRYAWINHQLVPKTEKRYRLEVRIPGEDVLKGETTVPSRLYVRAIRVRQDTGVGHVSVRAGVTAYLVPPDAFYYRAWSETWKLQSNGDTLRPRIEIPLYMNAQGEERVYSAPSRDEEIIFSPGLIRLIKDENEVESDSVIGRRLIVHGYGLTESFYKYYKVVRGFEDPVSVRLDSPDLSFIEGGLGVFGSMSSDSASATIYSFFK